MNAQFRNMKYNLALKSIALRYCGPSMHRGYQTDCATAFPTFQNFASDGSTPDRRASTSIWRNFR